MVKIESHCVGCTDLGMPCIGSSCSNRAVEVYYCDKCDPDCDYPLDDIYAVDDVILCEDCLKEKFRRN